MDPAGAHFRSLMRCRINEVHVWRTSVDLAASDFARLQQILSSDEREKADRFRFEVDRRCSVIGRGSLRVLLGQILDLPPESLQIECNEFGKPGLAKNHLQLRFNLSHSGNLILIAVARGRAVGVDVEKIQSNLDLDAIAARFFSTNERKILASLVGSARQQAFFSCWTRKEAYLKARGLGLTVPLDEFEVSFLPHEEARLLVTRNDPADAQRWRLMAIDLSPDYVAALAAEGSDWKLNCWDWDPAIFKSSH
jgi:4'-phosphopantetheinyl transferase